MSSQEQEWLEKLFLRIIILIKRIIFVITIITIIIIIIIIIIIYQLGNIIRFSSFPERLWWEQE